ncbi:MAG: DsrE family protein [Pseudomonadota bacterium]
MPRRKFIVSMSFMGALFMAGGPAAAQPPGFTYGPVIPDEGPTAPVPGRVPLAPDTNLKVAMDVVERAAASKKNRSFVTAARFINMHAAAGLPPERARLALVIHGAAVQDVTTSAFHTGANERDHGSHALIASLLKAGVTITVCGQSAAAQGITKDDLLPGVTLSLSAITAHALLQQDGYTLNPF